MHMKRTHVMSLTSLLIDQYYYSQEIQMMVDSVSNVL